MTREKEIALFSKDLHRKDTYVLVVLLLYGILFFLSQRCSISGQLIRCFWSYGGRAVHCYREMIATLLVVGKLQCNYLRHFIQNTERVTHLSQPVYMTSFSYMTLSPLLQCCARIREILAIEMTFNISAGEGAFIYGFAYPYAGGHTTGLMCPPCFKPF